jgi:hypothetical protein
VLQNVHYNLSIENGTWKFIAPGKGVAYSPLTNTEYGNLEQDQLYNLSTDIGEKVNLAVQNPQIVKKLRNMLLKIKAAR